MVLINKYALKNIKRAKRKIYKIQNAQVHGNKVKTVKEIQDPEDYTPVEVVHIG